MENESSICLWIKEKLLLVFMYQYFITIIRFWSLKITTKKGELCHQTNAGRCQMAKHIINLYRKKYLEQQKNVRSWNKCTTLCINCWQILMNYNKKTKFETKWWMFTCIIQLCGRVELCGRVRLHVYIDRSESQRICMFWNYWYLSIGTTCIYPLQS